MATVHAYPGRVNQNAKSHTAPPQLRRISRQAAKAPTKAEIERYLSLRAEAADLERAARTIRSEADLLGDKIETFIRSETRGKRRVTTRCGYELALEAGQVRPAWKQEFIAELGEEAAQAVIARTKPGIALRVEPLELKVKR